MRVKPLCSKAARLSLYFLVLPIDDRKVSPTESLDNVHKANFIQKLFLWATLQIKDKGPKIS